MGALCICFDVLGFSYFGGIEIVKIDNCPKTILSYGMIERGK